MRAKRKNKQMKLHTLLATKALKNKQKMGAERKQSFKKKVWTQNRKKRKTQQKIKWYDKSFIFSTT